jgi:signal transduction histidine kinase
MAKPTLYRAILRQHLWALILTLGVLLLGLLLVADILSLRARRLALARELRAIESVDISSPDAVETLSRSSQKDRGLVLVDQTGEWTAGNPVRKEKPTHAHTPKWTMASKVLAEGELEGLGTLPWVSDPVVWAARVMYDPDGDKVILVEWHRVSAIRATAAIRTTYAVVILATVLAAAVSLGVALRSGRRITRLLNTVADSSARMAAGDYQVHLPEQPVAELDRVSLAVNRLAADLREEHDRLVRLERLQRQFVADASHELRAPLTSMRVTIDAWLDGVLTQEEQPAAIVRLQLETEHLSGLVTRLLDLSRIESGREAVSLAPIDLAAVADEVAATFRDLPGAPIQMEFPAGLPAARADAAAVRRILQNLLENSRRFTPPTGLVSVSGAAEDNRIRLSVTDTGCGIAPDFLPRIWDRFARSAGDQDGEREGTGLGLAIVKALAQTMGGNVGVDSSLGSGTTIWVDLQPAGTELPSP